MRAVLCTGLRVVVALISQLGLSGALPLWLLIRLLLHAAGDGWLRAGAALFWIHGHCLAALLLDNRHCGVSVCVVVCVDDLCRC